MATQQILPSDFDPAYVTFSDPKPMGNHGGRMVTISYKGQPLALETFEMSTPYGASRFDDPSGDGGPKFSLSLSFGDYENQPKLNALFKTIQKIDELAIQKATENCQAWLRSKSMTTEVAGALYSSPIQFPKDKDTGEITTQYPPTLKTKLPYYDGKFNFTAWDERMVGIDLNNADITEVIPRRSKVRAVVRCRGLWIAGGKFGPMWSTDRMKIVRPESSYNAWPFIDDDTVDHDEMERDI